MHRQTAKMFKRFNKLWIKFFYLCICTVIVFSNPIQKNIRFPGNELTDYIGTNTTANSIRRGISKQFHLSSNRLNHRNITGNNSNVNSRMPHDFFRADPAKVKCLNSGATYCENVDEYLYPAQYVESILTKNGKKFDEFFNENKTTPTIDRKEEQKLSQRFGYDFDENVELCHSVQQVVYPRVAMNTQNHWSYVINQPSYRQAIRTQICSNPGEKCLLFDAFPYDYVTQCTQKYTTIPLLSVAEDGEVRSYWYKFASHCQCDLKKRWRKRQRT